MSEAVFSQSGSNKEAVKAFYHLYSQAVATAHFLKRQEPSANILVAQEKEEDEEKNKLITFKKSCQRMLRASMRQKQIDLCWKSQKQVR